MSSSGRLLHLESSTDPSNEGMYVGHRVINPATCIGNYRLSKPYTVYQHFLSSLTHWHKLFCILILIPSMAVWLHGLPGEQCAIVFCSDQRD